MPMRDLIRAVGITLALTAISCTSPGPSVSVKLQAQNGSDISGTARLIAHDGQTEVVISMPDEPANATEPARIHSGQCGATLGNAVYPLNSVVQGTSTTTVGAALSTLTNGNYAVNVHKSATQFAESIACGNIPARSSLSR